ncbi:MAG: helix-turn-helix domain-containing protein [Salibacteraceae bacterium]
MSKHQYIAKLFRYVRHHREESLRGFAQHFGVNVSTLHRWERGTRRPKSRYVQRLIELSPCKSYGDLWNRVYNVK